MSFEKKWKWVLSKEKLNRESVKKETKALSTKKNEWLTFITRFLNVLQPTPNINQKNESKAKHKI